MMRLIYTCLTEECGRCCEAERKKSAEGRSDEGDGGYYKKKSLITSLINNHTISNYRQLYINYLSK